MVCTGHDHGFDYFKGYAGNNCEISTSTESVVLYHTMVLCSVLILIRFENESENTELLPVRINM